MKKEFCVIGIGRFGKLLVENLAKLGAKVVAIDKEEEKILSIQDIAFESLIMDTTNEKALSTLDLEEFDGVIVTITNDIKASIMTCLLLKEKNAKKIIARARDELHSKILDKLGVSRIIFPEREIAEKLARSLYSPGLLEILDLSDIYVLEERKSLPEFSGKTLSDLKFRSKYGINIIAIKRKIPKVNEKGKTILEEKILLGPGGDEEIKEGDILFVLGERVKVEKLFSR